MKRGDEANAERMWSRTRNKEKVKGKWMKWGGSRGEIKRKWGGSGVEQEVECRNEEVKRKWMKWGGSRGEINRKWGGSEEEMGRK